MPHVPVACLSCAQRVSSLPHSCLAENETECPNCAREHGMIREIRRNNERLADQHELFLSEVREGGFSALAAGFGRGTLNMARVDDVAA